MREVISILAAVLAALGVWLYLGGFEEEPVESVENAIAANPIVVEKGDPSYYYKFDFAESCEIEEEHAKTVIEAAFAAVGYVGIHETRDSGPEPRIRVSTKCGRNANGALYGIELIWCKDPKALGSDPDQTYCLLHNVSSDMVIGGLEEWSALTSLHVREFAKGLGN